MTTALEASDDAIAGIRWLVSSGPNSPTTPALGVFRRIRRIRRNLLTLCEKMETIPGIHPLPPKNRRILELRRRRIGKAQVTPAPDARKKCTNTGDSQSEVAETTYVEIDGDHVVIHNFRSRNRMYHGLQFWTAFYASSHGIEVSLIHINTLLYQLVYNPVTFGFTNSTGAAYNPNILQSFIPPLNPVADPDDYVFWDGFHPTTNAHRFAAGFIFISVVSSRASPGSTLPLARLGVSASINQLSTAFSQNVNKVLTGAESGKDAVDQIERVAKSIVH